MKKRFLVYSLGLLLSLVSCGRFGTSSNDYNDLVNKYNSLLNTSYELQQSSQRAKDLLIRLDSRLNDYADQAALFEQKYPANASLTASDFIEAKRNLGNVVSHYQGSFEALEQLEQEILNELRKLYSNAQYVYKDAAGSRTFIYTLELKYIAMSNQLVGLRKILQAHHTKLSQHTLTIREKTAAAPALTADPPKRVEFTPEDKKVQAAVGSAGFARDASNQILGFKNEEELLAYALRNNFNQQAVTDYGRLSLSTNGLMGFAPSSADVPKNIEDMVRHFKGIINANADDMEVVLVIDYSRSMQDKIRATLQGLQEVVKTFKNIQASGRNVRLAIVTFGEPLKEKVELDFTDNMARVAQELARLDKEYDTHNHSVDPGEAIYHGLKKVLRLSWKSANRMSIAVTDEPAYELRSGVPAHAQLVKEVHESFTKLGIKNHVYTIIVR